MSLLELVVAATLTCAGCVLLVAASKQVILMTRLTKDSPAEQATLFINRCLPMRTVQILFQTTQMLIWADNKIAHGFMYRPTEKTICWIDAHDDFKSTVVSKGIEDFIIAKINDMSYNITIIDTQKRVTLCISL